MKEIKFLNIFSRYTRNDLRYNFQLAQTRNSKCIRKKVRTFTNDFPFYTWLMTSQIRSTWPVRSSTPSKNIHIPRDYDLSLGSHLRAILVDLCYCWGQGLWSVILNQVRRILPVHNGFIDQLKRLVLDPVHCFNHVRSRSHKLCSMSGQGHTNYVLTMSSQGHTNYIPNMPG